MYMPIAACIDMKNLIHRTNTVMYYVKSDTIRKLARLTHHTVLAYEST